ncbi:unnamed protein product [Cuscuta europaea]|uniref:Phosphatidate cytidylyltransferase, mitochondrial n=1 Tax=Cuscuta europaea TaxID=41803 RepID=A0A9P0ZXF7_CUSEU|nr:unnamed protein product [Cuscuta europaea]
MDDEDKTEFGGLLNILPPVEFCCVYGSILHPNKKDQNSMVDYILGVADPLQWHTENLKVNRDHYASWLVRSGGSRLINCIANNIGVGVHFNPFVSWNKKMFKYGVVRVHDLIEDIKGWERFYTSGRLQKPVNIIVDNLNIENVNAVNLRAAASAALLLLPAEFSEEDLYAKICSLSYMGDLRMYFAEDKNKDSGLSAAAVLVSHLPPLIKSKIETNLAGKMRQGAGIGSKVEAVKWMSRIIRRKVMVSSGRQAVAGLLTAGAVNGFRYLGNKILKSVKS